jgi:hypothetical protein
MRKRMTKSERARIYKQIYDAKQAAVLRSPREGLSLSGIPYMKDHRNISLPTVPGYFDHA